MKDTTKEGEGKKEKQLRTWQKEGKGRKEDSGHDKRKEKRRNNHNEKMKT
jgi:hypothetical protein